jgi:hypothetical protein
MQDSGLSLDIQGTGRFIKDQNLRVVIERSGETNALALATTQTDTTFANAG